ncbi:MAG: S-layer homology domain-containing protein, partial [Oscillospiraceae bacterium]|nr:S-layer homology domain-containing protein [Oscillospiraceae bacterium]
GGSGSSGGGSSAVYYTLTATAGEGGSISPSGKVSLRRNETKTFAITPEEGYVVADVLVDGKSVGGVTEYTFEKITANHTIEVVFQKTSPGAASCARDKTCPIARFPDAEPEAWYHDGVHYCLEKGLMVGVSENSFAPTMETSRAMIATILWRLSGSPEAGTEKSFPDCEAGSWYAQAVAWCAEVGVVKGYDSGDFGPEDPVTREQMALMLWQYAKLRGQEVLTDGEAGLDGYSDFDQAGEWAVFALRWAVGSGVMNGKEGNQLDPNGFASRAEAAAMLQRFFEM